MEARSILEAARAMGRSTLLEPEAKSLLREYGIAVPRAIFVDGDTDVRLNVTALRAPYVVKIVSADVLHKSDVGGVRVGLADLAAVRAAIAEMGARLAKGSYHPSGFIVEEMAPRGHELVVGGTIHPQFGPVLMTGLGGVFVEILNDVTFRLCPIDRRDALAMLNELRGRPILDGARGSLMADVDAVVAVLLQVGGEHGLLTELADDIAELDLNPLIAGATGAVAVDARVILARRTP
jgi:acyl-CoA synthetase (NDP forming)